MRRFGESNERELRRNSKKKKKGIQQVNHERSGLDRQKRSR
jgi:hypothetical protein